MSGAVATSRISLGHEWMASSPSSPLRPLLIRRLSGGPRPPPLFSKEECSAALCSTSARSQERGGGKVLKRKRPAMIDIPKLQATGFDAFGGGTARGAVGKDVVEEEGEAFAVCCKRGRRRQQMEDRHAMKIDADSGLAFFGVFDGHGGTGAAEFVSSHLAKNVMVEVAKAGSSASEMKNAIRAGYLRTDSALIAGEVAGGACSVTALVGERGLVISNAGDCRGVISRGGVAEALTTDHKPSRDDERDRIESLGGYVDCHNGVWRLQGTLAVSRGFGDALLKEYVTAEPETEVVKLEAEHEFVILATDGLWDKVSNQEAVDVARPICMGRTDRSVLAACRGLADLSISRGSVDDVTVMIVVLAGFMRKEV